METGKNWKNFILSILDGAYKLDIEKTGNVVSFIKTRVFLEQNFNTELENFEKTIIEIFLGLKFSVDDFYARPDIYKLIFDLLIEFMPNNSVVLKESASLFINIYNNEDNLSESGIILRDSILERSSYMICKYIESWKNRNQILQTNIHEIYDDYPYLKGYKDFCLLKSSENILAKLPNTLIIIIYLDEWKDIAIQSKTLFFDFFQGSFKLLLTVLNDMIRLDGNSIFQYFAFSDDCFHYLPSFYELICKKTNYHSPIKKSSNSLAKVVVLGEIRAMYDEYSRGIEKDLKASQIINF